MNAKRSIVLLWFALAVGLTISSSQQTTTHTMSNSSERLQGEIRRLVKLRDPADPGTPFRAAPPFEASSFPVLRDLRKEVDTTLCLTPHCIVRSMTFTSASTELHVTVLVYSCPIPAAREAFVDYVGSFSSLPSSVYAPGPADYGDFSIIYAAEAGKPVQKLVHFMRGNIGVTVWAGEGHFDVAALARQMDSKIAAAASHPRLEPLRPQNLAGKLSASKVRVGGPLELQIEFERKSGEKYGVSFATDNRLLEEESVRDGKALWRARMPGKARITATVWNSELLSATWEGSVDILQEPAQNREPSRQ